MPLDASDQSLLAEALDEVPELSPSDRIRLGNALGRLLPSLNALTQGIAQAKRRAEKTRVRNLGALPFTVGQLSLRNTSTYKTRSSFCFLRE